MHKMDKSLFPQGGPIIPAAATKITSSPRWPDTTWMFIKLLPRRWSSAKPMQCGSLDASRTCSCNLAQFPGPAWDVVSDHRTDDVEPGAHRLRSWFACPGRETQLKVGGRMGNGWQFQNYTPGWAGGDFGSSRENDDQQHHDHRSARMPQNTTPPWPGIFMVARTTISGVAARAAGERDRLVRDKQYARQPG